MVERRRTTQEQFPNDSGNGRYGIRESQLPHVADAMVLFNDAWSAVSRMTICKCSIKSECLGVQYTQSFQSFIRSLTVDDSFDINLTSSNNLRADRSSTVIDTQRVHSVHNALSSNRLIADEPRTPLYEIVEAVRNWEAESDLMKVLNSPALFDVERFRDDISKDTLINFYEKSQNIDAVASASASNTISEAVISITVCQSIGHLTQMASKMQKLTSDDVLLGLLQQVSSRAQELESQDSSE